jgi:hypothetical protein
MNSDRGGILHPRAWINQAFRNLAYSRLPFSIIFRWVILLGTAARVGSSYLLGNTVNFQPWLIALFLYLIYTGSITGLLVRNPAIQKRSWSFFLQLAVDTIFCSWFLILGDTVNSDLFLNYFLPFLIILENVVEGTEALFYYLLVSGAFLVALAFITKYCETGCTYSYVFVRDFLPRFTMFTLLMIFAIARNIRLADRPNK